jgi:hypothetical protein
MDCRQKWSKQPKGLHCRNSSKIQMKDHRNRQNTLSVDINYRICTVTHIRIEIIHGSQNVFRILTWIARILVNVITRFRSR